MAYIGKTPTIGNFQVCDAISVVNGQAAYTMQVGSVNVSPESANHMLVSLNGILQKPGSSYTVSGSTITFASNLVTGDVIDFIQILGNVLDLGVPSDATVTTAKLADSSVTAAKITDATITAAKLASGVIQNQSAFKNIIINGEMSIAQRGTSATGLTSAGYHTIDRFRGVIGSLGTWTMSQATDVPSGQGFATSLKMDCTTADASPAAGDYCWIGQRIEGQNLQYLKKGTSNAESTTISFWVKATKTGTNIVEFSDKDNTRHICQSYTINSTNTWEKKTITFVGDTANGFNNDNGESAELIFWLGAGSTYTSGTLATSWSSFSGLPGNRAAGQINHADSTSNEFYITGVQLEAGTTASDFEFLPVDVNLGRCLRYYNEINETNNSTTFIAGAHDGTNGTAICPYMFPVSMRAAPSVTYTGTFNCYVASAGTNKSDLGIQTGTRGLRTLASSVTGANGYAVHIDFAAGAKIHLSAEL